MAESVLNMQHVLYWLAVVGAGISVYTDIRWRLIKNYVTFPLIILGWGWSLFSGGPAVLLQNMLVSCVLGVLVCRAGKIGEGDIKLIVGIGACLQPMMGFLFLMFFFVTLLVAAIFVRLKVHNFKLGAAFSAMKSETMMELGGVKNANIIAHGKSPGHIGAPVIFLALIFCLLKAKTSGLI